MGKKRGKPERAGSSVPTSSRGGDSAAKPGEPPPPVPPSRDLAPAAPAAPPASAGPFGLLHRVDGAVFGVEKAFVGVALVAITIMVFVEVLQRRLDSPDSKIGKILGGLTGIGDGDPRRVFVDGTLAPLVGGALGVALLTFAVVTYERQTGKKLLPFRGGALVVGLGLAAVLAGVAWAILALPSRHVYAAMLVVGVGAYVAAQIRGKTAGWPVRVALAALGGAGALWGTETYFPTGYTWAKEVSTFLLLWVGFLGASLCVFTGKHIRLEVGEKLIPKAAHRYVAAGARVVTAAICAFFSWLGVVYLQGSGGLGVLEQTRIPAWIVTAAIPVAFGLTALRFVGSAVSSLLGGRYGDAAKDESLAAAEEAAAKEGRALDSAADAAAEVAAGRRKRIILGVVLVLVVALPFAGKGGMLASALLVLVLLGAPLFVVIGLATILCFLLWADLQRADDFTVLVERMRSLADNQALLAVPMFVMSGAIMSAGQIAARLVGFARALLGWMPGGLAISAVLACMIFAAISGSSPATVVAIGGMMGPTLIKEGFRANFSLGLVTSAGSLGILIPPSLPMIVYCIVNQRDRIEVERLFAAGFGPGFLIGGALMSYSLYRGIVDKAPRERFDAGKLWQATRDGFWSLLFPVTILGGIYLGIFNAVESAAISVVYALAVELFLHRALKLSDIPRVFQETALLLGSLLVILVVATSLGEFLEGEDIPTMAAQWVASMHLPQWQFLVVVNLLLLVVGCLMDIMSAIFIFVPLLAPMATALGVHPIHFAIVFIVNLEIGYLTPPVGLNLFVASTLFNRPIDFIIKSVLPFILVMLGCLMVITYWPGLTKGGAEIVMGPERSDGAAGGGTGELEDDEPGGAARSAGDAGTRPGAGGEHVQSLEEMMAELAEQEADTGPSDAGPADAGPATVPAAEDGGEAEPADPEPSF